MDGLKELSVKFTGDVSSVKKAVTDLQKSVNDAGKQITTSLGSAGNGGATGIKRFAEQVRQSLNGVRDNTAKTVSSVNTLSKSFSTLARFGRFFVFSYIGRQVAKLGATLFKSGADMTETQNLFEVSLGAMAEKGQEFADTLEKMWGVSATVTKDQVAYLNNMYKSLGLTEENAYGLSTALVQLSYNMSSLYNKEQVDVLYALRSATVGISRPIRSLGIETSVASLQLTAFKYGITSTNRELTRQEKVLATVWSAWEQTKSSWQSGEIMVDGVSVSIGDMTKTITTNANMLRVLKNQLGEMGRWWGLAFQPIAQFVLPLLYKLFSVIISLGKAFALFVGGFFGFKNLESMVGEFGTASKSVIEDVGDGFDDMADGTKKAKKELSNLIGGFDDLNVMQKETDTSGGSTDSSMGGGIENDIGIPKFDELFGDTILQKANEQIAAMVETFKQFKEPIENVLKGILGLVTVVTIFKGLLGFGFLGETFLSIKHWGFLSTLKGLFASIATPINIVIAVIALLVLSFIKLWNESEEFRTNIISSLQRIWDKFVEIGDSIIKNFIEPVVAGFIKFVNDLWDSGFGDFMEQVFYLILDLIELFASVIKYLVDTFGPVFASIFNVILAILAPILGWIFSKFGDFIEILRGVISFLIDVFSGNWEKVFETIGGFFAGIIDGIIGFLSGLWENFKLFIGWIGGKFMESWESTWNSVGDVVKLIVNGLFWLIENFVNFFIDGINWIISRINEIKLPDWLPSFLGGGKSLNIALLGKFSMPRLAQGGLAYGDTIAQVGEYANARSNPEVIAPLDKLRALLGNQNDNEEQINLMYETNALLRALLQKPTIDKRLVGSIAQQYIVDENIRTGQMIY